MKLLIPALLLLSVPALAQDTPKPEPQKLVYRALDKMVKDFSRKAREVTEEPRTRG